MARSKSVSARVIVHRPSPNADRPRWPVLGAVAAIALAVGILWPRACGLGFASAPEETAASAAPSGEPAPPPEVTSAPPATPPTQAVSSAPETPSLANVVVGKSTLMHCQDPPAAELKPSKCGQPALDPAIVPKLEALATCPAVSGVAGKLALTLDLDFKKQTAKVVAGKGSATSKNGRPDNKAIEPLLACVRASMATMLKEAADGGTAHEHERFVIAYPVTLTAHSASPSPSASTVQEKSASGTATVQVDTAIVRDAPSTNGQPIGRLSRGTKVTTVGTSGNWFHIKFGESDSQEGWIFRTNIGK